MSLQVRHTPEVNRILALPRRVAEVDEDLVREMTAIFRKEGGTHSLFPVQARALYEAFVQAGLIGNIDVGEGKTLITFLIAQVLGALRFLLLLPANLIEKTLQEHARYAEQWHITPLPQIKVVSYEKLGLVQYKELLEEFKPDLVACDEVHWFKDRKAARTRVMIRFMKKHPETLFVGLSGTLMQKSVRDFGHIVRWALKEKAPVPRTEGELEDWAWALDDKLPAEVRWDPGALLKFCESSDHSEDPVQTARKGFQRRLLETPGIVSTLGEDDRVRCSIYISPARPTYKPITEEHFQRLRGAWELPDGWQIDSAAEVWRHARELSLGFFYVWDPRPPQDWLHARREWNAFVREILSRSRTIDSEEHLAQTIDAGAFDDGGVLERWRAIRQMFEINQKAVWFDDSALNFCAEWMATHKDGIVWVDHVQFGERLAAISGRKYYGAEGTSADGELLTVNVAPGPVIASIKANKEGRNLQRWSQNLVTSPPDNADLWQQLIGRTHRRGQTADQVSVEIFLSCLEHASSFRHALSSAVALRDTIGARPKLLLADINWPSDVDLRRMKGSRWQRTG